MPESIKLYHLSTGLSPSTGVLQSVCVYVTMCVCVFFSLDVILHQNVNQKEMWKKLLDYSLGSH
jgi:hypothetical protein